jgi:serine/threonine protein kinase
VKKSAGEILARQQQGVERFFSSHRVFRSVMEERRLAAIGNYTVSNIKLGKGAFSTVKLARHNILGVNVAMKIIMRNRIKDPYVAKNLEREAAILGDLHHPKVVRLFEVMAASGVYCLIMEYFAGGTLCDLVQEKGRIEEAVARNYFCQIVSGLRYIHKQVGTDETIYIGKNTVIRKLLPKKYLYRI